MLVPFLIMLREGIEASLIVGIVAGYLQQTGRSRFLPAVWMGVVLACTLCLALGVTLDRAGVEFPQRQQEMFEGAVALIAVGLLTSMVFWMRRVARSLKGELQASIDAAIGRGAGGGQAWALVGMVFLAVGREGLESVFFLLACFQQQSETGLSPLLGALLGLAAAVAVGWGLYRGSVRLNLRVFFRWTSVFIMFVAAGLVAGAVRAFHEAGLWNGLQQTAFDTSNVLPADGFVGSVLSGLLGYNDTPTVGEVLAYLAFLLPALVFLAGGTATIARRAAPALAAGVLALLATSEARADGNAPVTITIGEQGCTPASLTVPSGSTTFRIVNKSKRAVEWEIIDGVMVVEERENIAPGFTQTLTATLQPHTYGITCGRLTNPKGALVVTEANAPASAAPPTGAELTAALAKYATFIRSQTDLLVASTKKLTDAVKAGHLDEAAAAYAPAHQYYEKVESVAELFNDLDGSMDARADDFEKREQDPKFVGFHRLEKAIFADKSLAGMEPVADQLQKDAETLQTRVASLDIPPKVFVGGAADLIEEVGSKKISGEEDRYSRTDLWDFSANVEGARAGFSLLRDLVVRTDPGLAGRIEANFNRVEATLAKYRTGDGFESYDKLTQADRTSLKGPVTQLAEDLSALKGKLGVE